ncbi:type I-E CRISPR-associated protein Cas5/CasD [Bifidobacterium choerinum]|uniref:type I-E CRISPR-associated protein Cas5/CasD n=1 Tax=Bifidobacterium choerinum TaxID=35760 RepID=UPI003F8FCBE3
MGSGVLMLRLAGPMQSWGDASRFNRRETRTEPTKSAIIGLLASAEGRTREDPIEDLLQLSFGVRVEQQGLVMRDYQTEKSIERKRNSTSFAKVLPVTNRYYLSDAMFLVVIGAPRATLETLDDALRHPRWPLYLGRRSCPPAYPFNLGIHEEYEGIEDALEHHPWQAASWYRRSHPGERLEIVRDAVGEESGEVQNDLPVSFSQRHREYSGRAVHRYYIANPSDKRHDEATDAATDAAADHDPMFFA